MSRTRGRIKLAVAFVVPLLIYFAMDRSIRATDEWHGEGAAAAEDVDAIVSGLFSDHVLTLEVLGVLLTAAMIGALVIARPLGQAPDKVHYWHDPDHEEQEFEQSRIPVGAPTVARPPLASTTIAPPAPEERSDGGAATPAGTGARSATVPEGGEEE